jgi:methionine sulfoxide reductase heme-binding subunit
MNLFHDLSAWKTAHTWQWRVLLLIFGLLLFAGGILGVWVFSQTLPMAADLGGFMRWLLAPSTSSVTWIVTRASGLVAYLLLWLSTAWGLAVSSRILEGKLHGAYTYDFHQFISLLSIGFLAIHLITLLLDSYTPYSLAQVLVPFLSTYRPLWVAVGILAFYLVLLVTITFYIRDRIGQAVFRAIHTLSLLAFVGAAVHGLLAGTDAPLAIVKLMYAGTFLSVVFLMTYWLVLANQKKQLQAAHALTR